MARTGRHIPLRRCVVCRSVRPKAELVRLVRGEGGSVRLDLAGRAGGRGTWICRECAAHEHDKRFRQAFRGQAEHVRDLLRDALGTPRPGTREARHVQDGGMNER